MIDFNTSQLTWIVVGLSSVGGTGYLNIAGKLEEVDKKVVVVQTHMEHQSKTIEQLQIQLDRIEQRVNKTK